MHGIIFDELKQFVERRVGPGAWSAMLAATGAPSRNYLAVSSYPDEQLVALVVAASAATKVPVPDLLHDFGVFLVPDLLGMYKAMIKPHWKTLDVVENTERVIHTVVRARISGAAPPKLKCERVSPERAILTYASERKLCAVARGIIKGLATHFDEVVTIQESACMLRGDVACRIEASIEAKPRVATKPRPGVS